MQRVIRATVSVGGKSVSAIGPGLLVLVGVTLDDTEADAVALAAKVVGLAIFSSDELVMNTSVTDIAGSVLVVSQFTLYADVRRGRRPSFSAAAPAPIAEPLVEAVAEEIRQTGVGVRTGIFGAKMAVELVNDGPVTIIVETDRGRLL